MTRAVMSALARKGCSPRATRGGTNTSGIGFLHCTLRSNGERRNPRAEWYDCSVRLPRRMKSLFWNVDCDRLDTERDADLVLSRVLERGRMVDVEWAIERYGAARIRRFFREAPRPELSRRTLRFWRVVLRAQEEKWPEPPEWRQSSSAPWVD